MGLFSSSKKKKGATVGLYGKHATAGDFLRLNASSAEVRGLDEWLSGGLAAAQRLIPGWDSVYPGASPISFIMRSDDERSGRCLVGTLTPSTDVSGRQYPLLIFAELERENLEQAYYALPHSQLLAQAASLLEHRRQMDHNQLLAYVGNLAPPDEEALGAALREHERYIDGMESGSTLAAMFGPTWAAQAPQALAAVRDMGRALNPSRPLPSWGLSCPLGRHPPGDAALWMAVLRRSQGLGIIPNALWSRDKLLLYFNRVPAKALTALWRPGWLDESLCDLLTAQMGNLGGAPVLPDQPLRALVAARG